MDTFKKVIIVIVCLFVLGGCTVFTLTPVGRALLNIYDDTMQKVDDKTSYDARKKVEDYCRASIASYETDRTTYEQYKDSDSELEQSWANQAKMRANKTANIYNEYILKNSYVFDGNIPNDIKMELKILD